MRTRDFLRKALPSRLRQLVRRTIHDITRQLKAPRMLWGYESQAGEYHNRTRISDTAFLYHPESIRIADNVFVWHYTILDGTGGLEIGEGTQIGAWVGIFTHSSHIAIRIYGDHYQEVKELNKQGFPVAPVKIGRYVFVGAGAKILPGVTVGDGALIAAGSIVNRNVNEFEIVAGNPAKVVGSTRELDGPYLEDPQLRVWYEEWTDARQGLSS